MRKPKVIKLKKGMLVAGDAAKVMPKNVPDESVDMILTSPPYDQLRSYNGYSFDFQKIARECSRVLKPGGVIVWVVSDATINGSESLTSFKQAIYFTEQCRLRLHDTMLFIKNNPVPGNHGKRYRGSFEYMFTFSKGTPKTFNPIELKPKYIEKITEHFRLEKDGRKKIWNNEILGGNIRTRKIYQKGYFSGVHKNLFFYEIGSNIHPSQKKHPATFPDQLAEDMIRTWTNPGDLILDPFLGSGTSVRLAAMLDRNYVGIEISQEYFERSLPFIKEAENFEPVFAEEEHRFESIGLDFE